MSADPQQWVLALTGLAAEPDVVQHLRARRQAVRRVTDVVELMAVAHAGGCDRVLVCARFPQMTREVAFSLAADGVAVWGLVDPGDDMGARTMQDWGITEVTMTPGLDLLRDLPQAGRPPAQRKAPTGVVIAVTGAAGAPGRSTVALNVAAEWGPAALLVDADIVAPALGFLLGLAPGAPGVAGACREAALGRLDPARLRAAAHRVQGVSVLPGATGAPPVGAADAFIDLCARSVPVTVVDCGGPGRGEVARAALARAARVIDVAVPSALGIRRWVDHLPEVGPAAARDLLVVWNQVHRDREQATLARVALLTADVSPTATVAGLCWDPRVHGRTGPLRMTAPRSRLRRGIGSMAQALGRDLRSRTAVA